MGKENYILKVLSILIFISIFSLVYAQKNFESNSIGAPEVEWDKTFGGNGIDCAFEVQQTLDGSYIMAGKTESFGAGSSDVWLIKTDSEGNMIWDKTFGGIGDDWVGSVQQILDGGYVLAGTTLSFGAGGADAWLIKTDSDGNMIWNKTFGGGDYDWANSVQQTNDGRYIIVGGTISFGAGSSDVWLIKTDSEGNEEWSKTFGGGDYDTANSVRQTNDGGYIIAASTDSFGASYLDFWLIKTDSEGNMIWDKTYGGSGVDWAFSVQQTLDSGYIVTGETGSSDFGELWLIKTDSEGNMIWDKTFGGIGSSVQQTNDRGYIVGGGTARADGGCFASPSDVLLIKTDSNGNKEWSKTYGDSDIDYAYSVQQTSDNGYIVAGKTESFGAGYADFWLIKLREIEVFELNLYSGWNLFSIPLNPLYTNRETVFPSNLVDAVWRYDNLDGYVVPEIIEPKKGYWVKAKQDTTIIIYGSRLEDDSVQVNPGWNLMGVVGTQTITESFVTAVWEYNNPGGYISPEILLEGKGFWIKSNATGILFSNQSSEVVYSKKDYGYIPPIPEGKKNKF